MRSKLSDGGEIVRQMDTKTDTSIHSSSTGMSALSSRGDVFKSTTSLTKNAVGYIEPTGHGTHVTLRSKSSDSGEIVRQMYTKTDTSIHSSSTGRSAVISEEYNMSGSGKDTVKHYVQNTSHNDIDNVSKNTGKHVDHSTTVKRKVFGRKTKYNVRRSTIRSSISFRNKSTFVTRYISRNWQENINMNVTLFNMTQHSVDHYNSSLLNDRSVFSTKYSSVDYKVIISVMSGMLIIFCY